MLCTRKLASEQRDFPRRSHDVDFKHLFTDQRYSVRLKWSHLRTRSGGICAHGAALPRLFHSAASPTLQATLHFRVVK